MKSTDRNVSIMDEQNELIPIIQFGRFATRRKDKAFYLLEKLNKESLEHPRIEGDKKYIQEWRVGRVIRNRVVIDVDSHNLNNLNTIQKAYSCLLDLDFVTLKTSNGFHLIAKSDSENWQYDVCQILKPQIHREQVERYINAIRDFFEVLRFERQGKEYTKTQLHELALQFPDRFKATRLYSGIGDFDILHQVNALVRGKYVLRISKKNPDDIIIQI